MNVYDAIAAITTSLLTTIGTILLGYLGLRYKQRGEPKDEGAEEAPADVEKMAHTITRLSQGCDEQDQRIAALERDNELWKARATTAIADRDDMRVSRDNERARAVAAESERDELKSQVAALQGQVATLEAKVQGLETHVKQLEAKQ